MILQRLILQNLSTPENIHITSNTETVYSSVKQQGETRDNQMVSIVLKYRHFSADKDIVKS